MENIFTVNNIVQVNDEVVLEPGDVIQVLVDGSGNEIDFIDYDDDEFEDEFYDEFEDEDEDEFYDADVDIEYGVDDESYDTDFNMSSEIDDAFYNPYFENAEKISLTRSVKLSEGVELKKGDVIRILKEAQPALNKIKGQFGIAGFLSKDNKEDIYNKYRDAQYVSMNINSELLDIEEGGGPNGIKLSRMNDSRIIDDETPDGKWVLGVPREAIKDKALNALYINLIAKHLNNL